jgi:hypothetical protein
MERTVFGVVFFALLFVPCPILALKWWQYRAMVPHHRIVLRLLSSSYVLVFGLNLLTSDYSSARYSVIDVNLAMLTLGCIFLVVRRRQWHGFPVACVSVWGSWLMLVVVNSAA